MQSLVSNKLVQLLKNQKYHLVGRHSAVKRCRWLYESLIHNRVCYKQKFYGIRSHQCLQMTPTLFSCTMHCLFCWRAQSGDHGLEWNETQLPEWDAPEDIIKEAIQAQLKILSGYKGNPKTDQEKYKESLTPKHAAISLTGEPTLYSPLDDLVRGFHKRGFTTFVVSNGTIPEALSQLSEEPTQLYISVSAFDKKTFSKTCRPQIPAAWEKLNETLSLLPSFKCPTVIRITLARNLNLEHPELYAQLIRKANPTYVEPKAYMHVGFSRLRLGFENMPTHREIQKFAAQLTKEMAYKILDESPQSRVVLLSRLEKTIKLSG
ncbi:MAG: 4-demethylwyosine synthase TYW1 [Candidatus Bathyarchaeota archaeon]|nr:MAG: 4-demethylwyosine synthase TYW1 [Candidatus Bathyarchaeota archaeon]